MPKYTFKCELCNTEKQYFCNETQAIKCPICSNARFDHYMKRQLPVLAGQEVTEIVNTLTNTKWKQDQQEILKERKEDYYWSVEVPRLVQKYSLKECLEQGWVWIDDNNKMHIYTKPPGKR